jgi:hypothetical protein
MNKVNVDTGETLERKKNTCTIIFAYYRSHWTGLKSNLDLRNKMSANN